MRVSIKFWGTIFTLLGVGVFGDLYAQDPEFTQFYANPLYLNPAFAGAERCPRVCMNYRNQWPALSGTFVTSSASYDQHVSALVGGIGLIATNDQAGQATLTTNTISGIYSPQIKLTRKLTLKGALQVTYFQKSLDWSKLTFGDMIDPRKGFIYQTGDTPRGGRVGNIDFSTGVLAFSDLYYGGMAIHHITQPDESLINGSSPLPMKVTAHAGALIPLENGRYRADGAKISPNILFRSQGAFRQVNMGLYVMRGPIVGGLWYRNKDAFIVVLGVQADMVKIGYSYDVTVSKLTVNTAGSHEVSFTINFDCKPKRKRYRAISCPSF